MNAFEEPAVARIAYLPLWHIEAYRRRGIPVKDHETLEACLVLSAVMGFCAVRIWDDLVDNDKIGVPKEELLLASLFNLESSRQLQRVFPSESPFWGYYERYWRDYVHAVGMEKERDRGGLVAYDETSLRLLGDKAAPLKSFPVAVALYAGQEQEIDRLNTLMDVFNQAAQLANDLQSLRRDLESRHFTVPITNAALAVGYEPGVRPPIDGLYGALINSGAVLETHAQARRLYERAFAASEELGIMDLVECLVWHLTNLRRSELRWERVLSGMRVKRPDELSLKVEKEMSNVARGTSQSYHR